jgi:hypothetical protein
MKKWRRNKEMGTLFDAVEMLAALSLHNRSFETSQKISASLLAAIATRLQVSDRSWSNWIGASLMDKLQPSEFQPGLGFQNFYRAVANLHYIIDVSRIRKVLASNSIFLQHLIYVPPHTKTGEASSSLLSNRTAIASGGNELNDQDSHYDSGIIVGTARPELERLPRDLLRGSDATGEPRAPGIKPKTRYDQGIPEGTTSILPAGKNLEKAHESISSDVLHEVLKLPSLLQTAVQAMNNLDAVRMGATTRSRQTNTLKRGNQPSNTLALQSYVISRLIPPTAKTSGSKQSDKTKKSNLSSAKLLNEISVPSPSQHASSLSVTGMAYNAIGGFSAASAREDVLSMPRLLQDSLAGMIPAPAWRIRVAERIPELDVANDPKGSKNFAKSPHGMLNIRARFLEGLTRNLSSSAFEQSNPSRQPIIPYEIPSLVKARAMTSKQVDKIVRNTVAGTYTGNTKSPASDTPAQRSLDGRLNLVSHRMREISSGQNQSGPGLMEGISTTEPKRSPEGSEKAIPDKDRIRVEKRTSPIAKDGFDYYRGITVASGLRQLYSTFTLENLLHKRRPGVAATTLLAPNNIAPRNLLSAPPSSQLRSRKDSRLDPFRIMDGSLDLPNVTQIASILTNHAVRGMVTALTTPVHAPATTTSGSNSRRPRSRQSHVQDSKLRTEPFSTISRADNDGQHYSSSRTGDIYRRGHEPTLLSGTTVERSTKLTLRELRIMMEQIFQEELKRYGL